MAEEALLEGGSKAENTIGGVATSQWEGMTAAPFPVPAVPGSQSRWRKMRTECGCGWEWRVVWRLRSRSPGLEFSDAAEPPGSEKVSDHGARVP